jgi:hypothetical protein
MNGYGFFRSIRFLFGLGILGLVILLFYIGLVLALWGEVFSELSYKHQYGAEWKVHYEEKYGSLAKAQSHMAIEVLGIAGLTVSGIMLVQGLRNRGRGQTKWQRPGESRIERRVRYMRNALLGIYFGVPTILFSVLLAMFRLGIFEHHSDEVSLAIFVFLGGYCAVVYGCYWWLRAKRWSEGVLLIAFMPLTIFFIPFVRLLMLQALGLLAAAMVMAPLILVVVVAALPDKSGHSRQRAPWERRSRHREHSRP